MHTYDAELEARRIIYSALSSFAPEDRGRILDDVQSRFSRERVPARLPLRAVEHIELTTPPDAA